MSQFIEKKSLRQIRCSSRRSLFVALINDYSQNREFASENGLSLFNEQTSQFVCLTFTALITRVFNQCNSIETVWYFFSQINVSQ